MMLQQGSRKKFCSILLSVSAIAVMSLISSDKALKATVAVVKPKDDAPINKGNEAFRQEDAAAREHEGDPPAANVSETLSSQLVLRESPRIEDRHKLEKIYVIHVGSTGQKAFTDRWLANQTKLPYKSITPLPIPTGDEWDWMTIYLEVAAIIENDINHEGVKNATHHGLPLILLDDFKFADPVVPTLERLESALEWIPDDFDIARIDCLRGGDIAVWPKESPDRILLPPSSGNGGLTPRAGWHAMLWRPSRLGRIKAALKKAKKDYASMECMLASNENAYLNSYCVNSKVHNFVPFGCFHHLKYKWEDFPMVESHSSGNVCGLGALPPPDFPKRKKISAVATNFNVTVNGTTYSYRAIPTARTRKEQDTSKQSLSLPRIVVGVTSMNQNFIRRQAIRQTWGKDGWRTFFIVAGRNFTEIQEEFEKYQDLIWLDNDEHYKFGLLPKTMAFLHFAESIMDEDMFAFKTDDDVWLNLTDIKKELSNGTIDYFGSINEGVRPVRYVGEFYRKWYISFAEYPRLVYPPYASGAGYATSARFLKCAVENMPTMLCLWVDDAAVGLLAESCHVNATTADWRVLEPHFHAEGWNHLSHPVVLRASIENQFGLRMGLEWKFEEDRLKWQQACPRP